jgi:ubiquinone/menaquinone biosynthesis C-methylase UbiE
MKNIKYKKFYEDKSEIYKDQHQKPDDELLARLKLHKKKAVWKAFYHCGMINENLLDIGTGAGVFLQGLSGWVGEITASDISEARIKQLKERGFNTQLLTDDNKLPFEQNSFYAVSCISTLDHIPLPLETLKEMTRVADKYVIITLGNDILPLKSMFVNNDIATEMLDKFGHITRLTFSRLNYMARKCDLELDYVYSYGFPFRFYYRIIKAFPKLEGPLYRLGRRFPKFAYAYTAVYKKFIPINDEVESK